MLENQKSYFNGLKIIIGPCVKWIKDIFSEKSRLDWTILYIRGG
jgi:hypothetical protein